MLYHAQVARIEDMRALLILKNRVILPRPLFFGEIIVPAAGLRAFAAVAVTCSKVT